LEEAKQLLERTELPIDAVANEVGYEGSFSAG
jgi:transcriptional regulator GlxA family with amidase domain